MLRSVGSVRRTPSLDVGQLLLCSAVLQSNPVLTDDCMFVRFRGKFRRLMVPMCSSSVLEFGEVVSRNPLSSRYKCPSRFNCCFKHSTADSFLRCLSF